MPSEFDAEWSARNATLQGRAGLAFDRAEEFDFERAIVREDVRVHPVTGRPYPERRFQAIGKLGRQFVMLVYTPRQEPVGFRTISLRPASREERDTWKTMFSTTTRRRS